MKFILKNYNLLNLNVPSFKKHQDEKTIYITNINC